MNSAISEFSYKIRRASDILSIVVVGACIIQREEAQSGLNTRTIHKPRLSKVIPCQRRPLSADDRHRQFYISSPLPSPISLKFCTHFTPSAALIGYQLLIYIFSLVQSGALANAFGHRPASERAFDSQNQHGRLYLAAF